MNKDFINYIENILLPEYIDYELWTIQIKFQDDSVYTIHSYHYKKDMIQNIIESKNMSIKEIIVCYNDEFEFTDNNYFHYLEIEQYTIEDLREAYIIDLNVKIDESKKTTKEELDSIKKLENKLKNILEDINE